MKKTPQDDFDPQAFLARAGEGRTVLAFHKNETVFSQGDAADTVFYIQKSRVKVVVLSEQGKEAVVGILEPAQFFGEACLSGNPLRILTPTALHGAGGMRDHRDCQDRNACRPSQRAESPGTPSPSADKKSADKQHKGMMGDGTEEQNLNQPGTPGARIEKDQVTAAFEKKAPPKS
jgi:Cyclic nucleotide-binding domain